MADNRPYPRQVDAQIELVRRGLTVREAARRMGVGRAHLSAVLNGLVATSPAMARRLGAFLDLDPDDLLQREEVGAP